MWRSNGLNKTVYFYVKNFRCYNMFEKSLFAVTLERRKEWENGGSIRIGADCLGEWKE